MQRNPEESFEAYKARRAISNQAVKDINKECRNGGTVNSRANRPGKGVKSTSYGELIRSHFALKRVK